MLVAVHINKSGDVVSRETSATLSERVGASAPSAVVMFQNHLSRQLFHLSRISRLYYNIHVMSACDRASGIKVRTFQC